MKAAIRSLKIQKRAGKVNKKKNSLPLLSERTKTRVMVTFRADFSLD